MLSFFKNKSSEPAKYEKVSRSCMCHHVAGFIQVLLFGGRGDFCSKQNEWRAKHIKANMTSSQEEFLLGARRNPTLYTKPCTIWHFKLFVCVHVLV